MKYKVIIIDDEPPIRKALCKIINQHIPECSVVGEADNGIDGMMQISEKEPDIIITDIFMPQTDGLDMVEKAKTHAKIIVITGFRDFDKARQAVHLNAFDMLVKPINHSKLIGSIKRAIDGIKIEKLNSLNVLFTAAVNDCDIPAILNYANLISKEITVLGNTELPFIRYYFTRLFFTMQEIRDTVINNNDEYSNNESLKKMIEQTSDINELIDVFESCVNNITKNMKQINLTNISKHIQMAIDYINENYRKKLSLEDVSQYINLSVVHTSRLFKKETGKTVLDYINEAKLTKAKQMLDSGKYKVYEVADELGFNTSHYFSTLFKKFTGVTPSEYLQNKHINQ